MRATAKKLVTLGLTALMVLGTFTTAFAADPALTIYGQKPVKSGEMTDNNGNVFLTSYIVIIPETEILDTSNITVANGWVAPRTPGWFTETTLNLGNYSANEGDFLSISCDNFETSERYMFQYLPTGVSVESLGEDAKYVIYANGSTQTAQPTEKTSSWASDSKGWWIQNSDGSYLTNSWYQSPTSGLWYYMGADGYMLTNTTTPDGCVVNSDGVWVENPINSSSIEEWKEEFRANWKNAYQNEVKRFNQENPNGVAALRKYSFTMPLPETVTEDTLHQMCKECINICAPFGSYWYKFDTSIKGTVTVKAINASIIIPESEKN